MTELNKEDIINGLVARRNYSSVLEVSTAHSGFVFDRLRAPHKERVRCTDDIWGDEDDGIATEIAAPTGKIWRRLADDRRLYDLIFLDGVHTLKQCREDLAEGLKRLTARGCLVVHDCNPPSDNFTGDRPKQGAWCGEMYRAFCELRVTRGHKLAACVVDTDCGCGIVERASNVCDPAATELRMFSDFNDFLARRTELLNLISPAEFTERFIDC